MTKSTCATIIIFITLLLYKQFNTTTLASTLAQATLPTLSRPTPALQLAKTFHQNIDIKKYWVSEKLDGVRGYWTGKDLVTRNGHKINAPLWFTANWPPTPLDGELWFAREHFASTSGCVRKKKPNNDCWQKIRFMIFDLPDHGGNFNERVNVMTSLIAENSSDYLQMIAQVKVATKAQLYQMLADITDAGGEGLMLHQGTAYYQQGRTNSLLKLKRYQDAEAEVIEHLPGKGKYQGMMGALKVKTPQGLIFNIGTGFSDQERRNPIKIGQVITYKYIGKTRRGVPRFASFMRVKAEVN